MAKSRKLTWLLMAAIIIMAVMILGLAAVRNWTDVGATLGTAIKDGLFYISCVVVFLGGWLAAERTGFKWDIGFALALLFIYIVLMAKFIPSIF